MGNTYGSQRHLSSVPSLSLSLSAEVLLVSVAVLLLPYGSAVALLVSVTSRIVIHL